MSSTVAVGVLCHLTVGCAVTSVVTDACMAVGVPVAVVVANSGMRVPSHRFVAVNSGLVVVHHRSVVMYSGLWHVAVSIEVNCLVVVAASVGHEHLWMCVEEVTSVVASV